MIFEFGGSGRNEGDVRLGDERLAVMRNESDRLRV